MIASASNGTLVWIEAALVIFLVVFVVVSLRAVMGRRGRYDDAAHLPLDDGADHHLSGGHE